jgi:hypothetical protein
MKLNEVKGFGTLRTNTAIKEPLNSQGFNIYPVPLTGIEVEVENVNAGDTQAPSHSWRVENDGSLRNMGIEYISLPTKPEHIESAITYLFDDILPTTAHFSPRTSIHIHLNCRELDLMQIYNIVITYQCFEDLLYDFAGKERKKSIFCVPVGNTSYYRNMKALFQANDLVGWSKYTGLNLGPLNEYGTIEFRHLRGTNDKRVLFKWLHLLYSLYNYAINVSTEVLESRILEVSRSGNYGAFGYQVFGGHFFDINNTNNFHKKMAEDLAISKLFMNNTTFKGLL